MQKLPHLYAEVESAESSIMQIKIQAGIIHLRCDKQSCKHANDTPHHRGNCKFPDYLLS